MSSLVLDTLTEDIEKISKAYATNHQINRDQNWYLLKLQEELGELTQAYLMYIGQARTKGKSQSELRNDFEKESADVLCHILLLMKHHHIDIDKVIKEKWLVWLDENGNAFSNK